MTLAGRGGRRETDNVLVSATSCLSVNESRNLEWSEISGRKVVQKWREEKVTHSTKMAGRIIDIYLLPSLALGNTVSCHSLSCRSSVKDG